MFGTETTKTVDLFLPEETKVEEVVQRSVAGDFKVAKYKHPQHGTATIKTEPSGNQVIEMDMPGLRIKQNIPVSDRQPVRTEVVLADKKRTDIYYNKKYDTSIDHKTGAVEEISNPPNMPDIDDYLNRFKLAE